MNKNKIYTTWQIIYIICAIFSTYYYLKFGAILLLCDSGEAVNDFIINDTNIDCERNSGSNNSGDPSLSSQGLLFKFKRKLSWYLSGKKSGKYNTYNEFKKSFSSGIKLKDIIKKDFDARRQALRVKEYNNRNKLRENIKLEAASRRLERYKEASKSDWYKNKKDKEASKSNWYNNKE